jgi:Tol biopolymer transport system component
LQKNLLSLLIVILVVGISHPLGAQDHEDALFTVSSLLPRLTPSPFEGTDYLPEILELDSGQQQVALAFWGADALAYPNRVWGLRWSPEGNRLAMVFEHRDAEQTIAIYQVDEQTLLLPLPEEVGFSHLSPPEWSADGEHLLFSAVSERGEEAILQLSLADSRLKKITEGRLPVFSPDQSHIAFLNGDGKIAILKLGEQDATLLDPPYQAVTSLAWSPDGGKIAVTYDAYLVIIELDTQRNLRVFDAYYHLNQDLLGVEVRSAAWSPDSQAVAVILNAQTADGYLSQVLTIDLETSQSQVIVERDYRGSLPADPRQFMDVTFQARGAFLPSRENRSEL